MTPIFTDITYQDLISSHDLPAALSDAVRRYRASEAFRRALDAEAYFRGEGTAVSRKTVLRVRKLELKDPNGRRRSTASLQDVVGNRVSSMFLHRFVTQQVQYLLGNGCTLEDAALKRSLGTGFDHTLARAGEAALLHGVCWLFWNEDHCEPLPAVKGPYSGFCPIFDELDSRLRCGIQFWQLGPRRPRYLRFFEEDGVSLWREGKDGPELLRAKEPYVRTVTRHYGGGVVPSSEEDAAPGALPIVPFWGNPEHRSELTDAIRSKIDAYDRILSDFADNLDRANDVYWVLNNFGGTAEDVAETLETIHRLKAVAAMTDGSGQSATAEPRTIEVPYAAREAALKLLHRNLYEDYMALDMDELTGGSLTNVAIRTAAAALDLKADRFEWQAFACVQGLLRLRGHDTDAIRFQRQDIGNASETVADIAVMRQDIDRVTALKLNPYIQTEEVERIAGERAASSGR